jgi:hypothetical protein
MVGNDSFSIHLTDKYSILGSYWNPSVAGRLDGLINSLLAKYFVFIMLGLTAGELFLKFKLPDQQCGEI